MAAVAPRVVRASRTVAASPQAVFDLLADPSRHREIDGSGTLQGPTTGTSERLRLGSTFSMGMRYGVPYVTRNRVVEFDEPRRIAWHHASRFVWRYELEAVDGGTKVTESFDYSAPWGALLIPLGVPKRNLAAIEATLARLEAVLTTDGAPA